MSSGPMILVTFHKTSNVLAYSADDGKPIDPPAVLPSSTHLDEPRGIYLDSASNLFVVDGGSKASTVYYCVRLSPGSYAAPVPIIRPETANSIKHPYALAFDPTAVGPGAEFRCFISNQDSNVIAAFAITIPNPFDPKEVMVKVCPVASYLTGLNLKGEFLNGSLVASAVDSLPDVLPDTPPAVPTSQGGLDAILGPDTSNSKQVNSKVQHSVRDLAVVVAGTPGTPILLAIDEAAGVVRMYDPRAGTYLGHSEVAGAPGAILDGPAHLLVIGTTVYVSFADQIYSGTVTGDSSSGLSLSFAPVFNLKGATISGMAVDGGGNFYLADRKGRVIYKYDSTFTTMAWKTHHHDVKDEPEFLLYIAG